MMKRFGLLMMVCALLIASTLVFAEDKTIPDTNQGTITWTGTGESYFNDKTINRKVDTYDNNGSGQLAQVDVQMNAYIPCYLKLELTGNGGKSTAESFGPKQDNKNLAQAKNEATGYNITFENEMGGFVNKDWKSLGAGRNLEVAPGPDVFIAACDVFRVTVYSNDNFQYDVIASPLSNTTNSAIKLNLEMGTSQKIDGAFKNNLFDVDNEVFTVGLGNPCQTLEYYHKFRVPYSTTTVHGGYNGKVTFKAYTI